MWRSVTTKGRWGRAAAVLVAIASVLVALVVVTNQLLSDRRRQDVVNGLVDRSNVQPAEIDQQALEDEIGRLMPVVGPVPLGGILTVTGDPGLVAVLQAGLGNAAGVASYTVRIKNVGTKSFDGSFSTGGAWLDTEDGGTLYPPVVRTLTTGSASPSTIGPATEADLVLVFNVPTQVRPTRLRLSLRLGQIYPTAEWNLTS